MTKWKKFVCATLIISVVLISSMIYFVNQPIEVSDNTPQIVIRVDDVQDYAFKEAQLFLLNYSTQSNIPLSLAVIPAYFGQDNELVEAVKKNIDSGSEILVHGWEHENMSQYTLSEQRTQLLYSKQLLKNTLDFEADILVPPSFSYNNDTIRAMEETGYTTISGLAEFHKIGWVSEEIQSIPATIEMSVFSNNTWQMRSISAIIHQMQDNIEEFGYAMLVTHPQEFMTENEVNLKVVGQYEELLQKIEKDYSFTTIEELILK